MIGHPKATIAWPLFLWRRITDWLGELESLGEMRMPSLPLLALTSSPACLSARRGLLASCGPCDWIPLTGPGLFGQWGKGLKFLKAYSGGRIRKPTDPLALSQDLGSSFGHKADIFISIVCLLQSFLLGSRLGRRGGCYSLASLTPQRHRVVGGVEQST